MTLAVNIFCYLLSTHSPFILVVTTTLLIHHSHVFGLGG